MQEYRKLKAFNVLQWQKQVEHTHTARCGVGKGCFWYLRSQGNGHDLQQRQ